jgi:glutathione S-transferase
MPPSGPASPPDALAMVRRSRPRGRSMKLMHGRASPFVRKVMVAAIEKGIDGRLELVMAAVGSDKINAAYLDINPIGKIPTLVLDDGSAIYDSLVIVEYFDQISPEPRLVPAGGAERLRALKLHALADGLMTAAMLVRAEAGKAAARQWPEFLASQMARVETCLARLELDTADAHALTIGEIAAGCALGWLEFRMPQIAWREPHPRLAAWFDAFSARGSMQRTQPVG